MSSARSGGPGHADWRQGCAPSSADQWATGRHVPDHRGVLTCCANSKEHRRNANTPRGSRRVTGGIDWASDDHAVAVVDPDGVAVKRCTFEHPGAGLRALVKALQGADVDASASKAPTGRSSTPFSKPA